MDTVNYNRDVFDSIGLDLNFQTQVRTALSNEGVTSVFPVGKYILIFRARKDELEQEMLFFDHSSFMNFRQNNQDGDLGFSENIVEAFEKAQNRLLESFIDVDDIFDLILV